MSVRNMRFVTVEQVNALRAEALLIEASNANLRTMLEEARRAIGDHHAPNDCYANGPMTGDDYRDLVQCPACSFIAMYDAALSKATGEGV